MAGQQQLACSCSRASSGPCQLRVLVSSDQRLLHAEGCCRAEDLAESAHTCRNQSSPGATPRSPASAGSAPPAPRLWCYRARRGKFQPFRDQARQQMQLRPKTKKPGRGGGGGTASQYLPALAGVILTQQTSRLVGAGCSSSVNQSL